MAAIDTIRSEARAHRTVLLTAREADGSIESREIEAYSIRPGNNGRQRLMYYCLKKSGTRSAHLDSIVDAAATGNTFTPRWPVEL